VIVFLRGGGLSFAAFLQPLGLAVGLVLPVVFLGERRVRLREVLFVDVLVALVWIVSPIRHIFTCSIGIPVPDCICKNEPAAPAAGAAFTHMRERES